MKAYKMNKSIVYSIIPLVLKNVKIINVILSNICHMYGLENYISLFSNKSSIEKILNHKSFMAGKQWHMAILNTFMF